MCELCVLSAYLYRAKAMEMAKADSVIGGIRARINDSAVECFAKYGYPATAVFVAPLDDTKL